MKKKQELFEMVVKFQEKILSNFSAECDIRVNCRPFQKSGDLKVGHLHVHLQPREFEVELYEKRQIFEKQIFKKLSSEEIKKISKILKN